MIRLGLVAALAAVSFTACGDDSNNDGNGQIDAPIAIDAAPVDASPDSATIDAPAIQYDYSCATNPAPTTAPANIIASGTVAEQTMGGGNPVNGATAAAVSAAGATVDSAITTADGAFSLDIATGGSPFDGHLRLSATGLRTTLLFPAAPLAESLTNAPSVMVSPTTFGFISAFAPNPQDDATNGALLVIVTDCTGDFVAGATVTVTQGGTAVGDVVDLGAIAPGTFAVLNVPAGAALVNAAYDGNTFRAHSVLSEAAGANAPVGTITATLVQPGYL